MKANAKTAKAVEALLKTGTKAGRYSAGANLYLLVGRGDRQRSWTYVYRWQGRLTACGLGSAFDVTLQAARKAATACRNQLDQGIKPGTTDAAEPGAAPTFGAIADQVIKAKAKGWKGDGSRRRWTLHLSRRRDEDGKLDGSGFCKAMINRPVNTITAKDVAAVLEPLWLAHPGNAEKTRGMIEAILSAAKALGHRSGDNPAKLENVKDLLPTQNAAVEHCAAHPYQTAPAFAQRLRAVNGVGARALEFLILTWTRDRETREAQWSEIDRANAVWIIPAERTKRNREHRVPLSARALAILDEQAKLRPADCDGSSYIFPGVARGRPVSNKHFRGLMDRLGSDATIHGWRSCGRDWAGETTAHPHDICEAALAHARKDRTHAAYQRGDLLEKRRRLMEAWSRYLGGASEAARPVFRPLARRRRLIFRGRPAPALAA